MQAPNPQSWLPAAPAKRLLVMIYDGLIVFAILAIGTMVLLPFTGGEAVPRGHWAYRAWLLLLISVYFVVSWVRAGQTVGMRAWGMVLIDAQGNSLRWSVAVLRFLVGWLALAAAGIGLLWMFIDPLRRGWHDLATDSMVVQQPRK